VCVCVCVCRLSEGERCPCGVWVTPAFHVQKSKVDVCRTPPVAMTTVTMTALSPKPGCFAADSCSRQTVNCNAADLRLGSSPDGLQK